MHVSGRLEQQHEGQEHEFLFYETVDVYFMYSFTWDLTLCKWEQLCTELKKKGWKLRPLHERVIQHEGLRCNYQPNLVFNTKVLEKTCHLLEEGNILFPQGRDEKGKPSRFEKIPIDLRGTVRLFDNGAAIFTLRVSLRENAVSFRNIHAVLHLAHNVDIENNAKFSSAAVGARPIVLSFLEKPATPSSNGRLDHSLFPGGHSRRCTLHDLLRRLLTNPPEWAPSAAKKIWKESDVVWITPDQDFQSPFVFTVVQVERNSFLRFRKHPTLDANREVASILCKITLDNRYIEKDFLHLSENYLRYFLKYDVSRETLINLCLDRRLFFTMSRRGAIAMTPALQDIPSYFVVPSLLNLCEILRARWHMSNVVSARLDQATTEIERLNPSELMNRMFKWRMMFAAFLRDPVPFLFDGGSVTEIAEFADREIWLKKLRNDTYRKFETLDRLVQDFLERKRIEELTRLRQ